MELETPASECILSPRIVINFSTLPNWTRDAVEMACMLQFAFPFGFLMTRVEEKIRVVLRLRILLLVCLTAVMASAVLAQSASPTAKPTPKPTPVKIDPKNLTAEQVVNAALFFYGGGGGQVFLNQIRKTTIERGVTHLTNSEGKVERVPYRRFIVRGDSLAKEKIRLDQEFPSATYSLIHANEKIFGILDNIVFTPREYEYKIFENQIIHGLESLLRYKENESTLVLAAREKLQGVDYYVLEVADKQGRKTKFYVSSRSYRVMMLTYEQDGVKYRRRFYDYNTAQNTLVPFHTTLWANDKVVEDTELGTVTFGQKVDESLFPAS